MALKISDFQKAADILDCELAAIRAVATIESSGKGFRSDGFPTIRFEGHVFREETKKQFDRSHPHLSYPYKYADSRKHGRAEYDEASRLDPIAAVRSTSWGAFQIMGFHYRRCGFSSLTAFVDAHCKDDQSQLLAFVNFIQTDATLLGSLRNRNWAAFAKRYNGAGYRKNAYDTKLAAAYERFARQKGNSKPKASAPASEQSGGGTSSPLVPPPATTDPKEPLDAVTDKLEVAENVATKAETISRTSLWVTLSTKVGGWALLVWAFAKENWVELVVAGLLIAVAIWYLSRSKDRAQARSFANGGQS